MVSFAVAIILHRLLPTFPFSPDHQVEAGPDARLAEPRESVWCLGVCGEGGVAMLCWRYRHRLFTVGYAEVMAIYHPLLTKVQEQLLQRSGLAKCILDS